MSSRVLGLQLLAPVRFHGDLRLSPPESPFRNKKARLCAGRDFVEAPLTDWKLPRLMDLTQGPYWQNMALLSQAASRKLETSTGVKSFMLPLGVLLAISIVTLLLMRKQNRKTKAPPAVPGLPLLGNLLQLASARPHKIFTKWSEKYGPIYTIRTGQKTQVIVTSPEIAKEALVTKYAAIPNRDLPAAITKLTRNKRMVAMYDHGERYRLIKRFIMNHLLGQNPQKSLKHVREESLNRALDELFEVIDNRESEVDVRAFLSSFLFRAAMYQMFGREVTQVEVPELGQVLDLWEMFKIIINEPMRGAVTIDWRDFFPSLCWVPNSKVESRINEIEYRRSAVVKALIEQQKKVLAEKARGDCYCDILLENSSQLMEDELLLGVWEPLIESSDTTLVTSEWAMYQLALHPEKQERLYDEIIQVAGKERMVCEDDLPKLPYLNAVIKETLRMYAPVPILPPRLVQEEVELGGYTIPAGSQLIVNVYGVHNDKKRWNKPEVWDPARVMGDDKLDLGISDMRVMPFGGGRRICAGITQAFYTVPMAVASLVQHFEWSLPPREQNTDADTDYFTTQKLVPLRAVAKPRFPSRLS